MTDFTTTCPYGRKNDPYPGQCQLYVDTNNDQICDRSQLPPAVINPVFWYIAIPCFLYFLGWFLIKKKTVFKYLCNVVLLILFIPTGIFGLLIAFNLKSAFLVEWHNKLGVSFVTLCFFHVLLHLKYFKLFPTK